MYQFISKLLLNNRHFVDQRTSSLQEILNDFSVLRVRKCISTPFGLDHTIYDDGSICGKNAFDKISSHIQSFFASFNTVRSQFFDCGSIFGSERGSDRCGINCLSTSENLSTSIGITIILSRITITIWLSYILGGSKGKLGKTKDGKSSNLK